MAISNSLLGLLAIVVPLLLVGGIILRKLPWVLMLFVVALAVGSGYLHQTGALRDVGQKVRPMIPAGLIKEHTAEPTATPAVATPPADGGAMKPAEPPAMAPAAPAPSPSTSPPPTNP